MDISRSVRLRTFYREDHYRFPCVVGGVTARDEDRYQVYVIMYYYNHDPQAILILSLFRAWGCDFHWGSRSASFTVTGGDGSYQILAIVI